MTTTQETSNQAPSMSVLESLGARLGVGGEAYYALLLEAVVARNVAEGIVCDEDGGFCFSREMRCIGRVERREYPIQGVPPFCVAVGVGWIVPHECIIDRPRL